jgi:hypothetical protein
MSKRVGDVFVICPEPPEKCELCGKVDELRPYGPGGKRICFRCGMKDKEGTMRRFRGVLDGSANQD